MRHHSPILHLGYILTWDTFSPWLGFPWRSWKSWKARNESKKFSGKMLHIKYLHLLLALVIWSLIYDVRFVRSWKLCNLIFTLLTTRDHVVHPEDQEPLEQLEQRWAFDAPNKIKNYHFNMRRKLILENQWGCMGGDVHWNHLKELFHGF